eukprot:2052104-Pyramimonas_sp.AAC.1
MSTPKDKREPGGATRRSHARELRNSLWLPPAEILKDDFADTEFKNADAERAKWYIRIHLYLSGPLQFVYQVSPSCFPRDARLTRCDAARKEKLRKSREVLKHREDNRAKIFDRCMRQNKHLKRTLEEHDLLPKSVAERAAFGAWPTHS